MCKKMIVIEGLDGSGKATQAEKLYQKLIQNGYETKKVSFPNYDSDSSALIKMYLSGKFGTDPMDVNAYAASSFYAVDRYASYKENWGRHYENGGIIIADRYTTSNAIHQCSKLPKNQWDQYLEWLFDYEYKKLGIPSPSKVIYLRVDPEVSQKLMSVRYEGNEDKKDIHEKDLTYLNNCRVAADYCAKKFGWTVIECTFDGKMKSIDEISREIICHLKDQIKII